MAWCQCAACGEQFSSVTAFDRHQTRGDGSFGSVTCHEPSERGLVQARPGIWNVPLNAAGRLRLEKMRAETVPADT